MRILYLIRHAKSCWEDPSLMDKERPLNKRGERDAPFMAQQMMKNEHHPDLIVSSPARRAVDTAEVFAQVFKLAKDKLIVKADIFNGSVDDLTKTIMSIRDAEAHVVYLVGHNPTITNMANLYRTDNIDNIPTSGIVRLDCKIDNWAEFSNDTTISRSFYYPKMYTN